MEQGHPSSLPTVLLDVEALVALARRDPAACVCSACLGLVVALAYYMLHRHQDVLATPNVAFITDVEGNWEYFVKCIELSPALRLISIRDDGSADVELRPGWHFVFGGDSVDKGGAIGGSMGALVATCAARRAPSLALDPATCTVTCDRLQPSLGWRAADLAL